MRLLTRFQETGPISSYLQESYPINTDPDFTARCLAVAMGEKIPAPRASYGGADFTVSGEVITSETVAELTTPTERLVGKHARAGEASTFMYEVTSPGQGRHRAGPEAEILVPEAEAVAPKRSGWSRFKDKCRATKEALSGLAGSVPEALRPRKRALLPVVGALALATTAALSIGSSSANESHTPEAAAPAPIVASEHHEAVHTLEHVLGDLASPLSGEYTSSPVEASVLAEVPVASAQIPETVSLTRGETLWEAAAEAGVPPSEILSRLEAAVQHSGIPYTLHVDAADGTQTWFELHPANGTSISDPQAIATYIGLSPASLSL